MTAHRKFLEVVLASGLHNGVLAPADLIRHAPPAVLAERLTVRQKAKLLAAGLAAGKMSPQLILDTVGIEGLVEHVPAGVLWACVAEMAGTSLGTVKPASNKASPPRASNGTAPPAASPAPVASADGAGKPRDLAAIAQTSPKRRPARLTPGRRGASDFDVDIDTDVGEHWPTQKVAETDAAGAAAVEDWQGGDETVAGVDALGRKR